MDWSLVATVATFLAVLTVLVTAHEVGHFVVARVAGIRVLEFGFGYPPRVASVTSGETTYSLNVLPLGGFVRMDGETGEGDVAGSFAAQPKRARAAVLVAGSAMNLLLAPLCLATALMLGEMVPCDGCGRVQVYEVQPGTASQAAGVRDGDVITSISGTPVSDAAGVRAAVRASDGRSVLLKIERSGTTVEVPVVPRVNPQSGLPALGVAIGPEYVLERRSFLSACPTALIRSGNMAMSLVSGLMRAFEPEAQVQLAGPVGIAEMTGRAARQGAPTLLQFTAFLSLNLAIFNLVPIPGLDGARLLFVAIEGVRGRRVSPRFEGAMHLAGMLLLIAIMLVVSFRDIQRLIAS